MRTKNPVRTKDGAVENFCPKVDGKLFRCDCKCNVFHKPDDTKPDIFKCNACGTLYLGAEPEAQDLP